MSQDAVPQQQNPAPPCVNCGTNVEMPVSRPQIVNLPTMSMVVVEHPTFVTCPSCGSKLSIVVSGIQNIGLGTIVVKDKPALVELPPQKRILIAQ